ncbi:hypothetical protein MHOCP_19030 [Moorella humiferrea]|uniref:DUF1634 domain-containing protein n=1 Tax=Neomoorella humiferrea TaxID=676965 RepID=UPI0030D2A2C2
MAFSQPQKQAAEKETFMIEDLISLTLRMGVILSSMITAGGLLLLLFSGQSGYPTGNFPTSISQVLSGLFQLKPFAIIETGLLILLLTPVFWVAASIFAFFIRRDFIYTLISIYVLLMLLLSFLLGKAA